MSSLEHQLFFHMIFSLHVVLIALTRQLLGKAVPVHVRFYMLYFQLLTEDLGSILRLLLSTYVSKIAEIYSVLYVNIFCFFVVINQKCAINNKACNFPISTFLIGKKHKWSFNFNSIKSTRC